MNKHDKENIPANTKIPLPLAPLPALPQHLLKKLCDRLPLNTLAGPNGGLRNVAPSVETNTQCLAGPSNLRPKSVTDRPQTPFKIDTNVQRHHNMAPSVESNTQCLAGPSNLKPKSLTDRPQTPFKININVQRGCGNLGYDFAAYNDDKRRLSEPSVISVSSVDEHDAKEKEKYCLDKENFANTKRKSTSTPDLKSLDSLQPARVRNIKRSLKRPHSRELQGITPLGNQEKVDFRAKRRLNFNQTIGERMQSPDLLQQSYMANIEREYTPKIFPYLLSIETKAAILPRVKSETRACVINWLMKINGLDGNPATIQTAIWYLDAVQMTGHVSLENMQLVAAAAYWIATKVHGPLTSASKLVKYSNYAFSGHRLLEAEKIILSRLKFPRQPVIPQDYLCYFAWWCNKEKPGETEVAATFICLCGMMVNKTLCYEYPSVIAAAAIRNALLLLSKKELMPRLQKCPAFVAAEKKALSMSNTGTILRHAVRTVAARNYAYKYLFEQYGTPPKYIAQIVAKAANKLAVMDTRSSAVVF